MWQRIAARPAGAYPCWGKGARAMTGQADADVASILHMLMGSIVVFCVAGRASDPPCREPARPPPSAAAPVGPERRLAMEGAVRGRRIAARWVAVVGRRWAGLGLPSCVRERSERAMRV